MRNLLCFMLLMLSLQSTTAQDINTQKADRIAVLIAAGLSADDLALIQPNIDQLSLEQLDEITRFMTDASQIASSDWFDVSAYHSWDEYNFQRPLGDTVLTILARRDLFLDAAHQLNNPALTNMSADALAALAFAQVYVEEKWDQQPPWDGDADNAIFNWVHPAVLQQPNPQLFFYGNELDQLRGEYWWATYWSFPLALLRQIGIGKGTDITEALQGMQPPNSNAPRLAGYAYPLGNQLYLQTAETVYWYADYLRYGAQRYGDFEPHSLDTQIDFPSESMDSTQFDLQSGLSELFYVPFAADLRRELTQPESAAFWNVMRFVHAGARQREGGASPDSPENGQPAIFALRYDIRTPQPVGRSIGDISAFALLTTVYSDSILLDFTNWDANQQALIVTPTDADRPDQIHRQVSERNKAIFVIEQLGNELDYANATHISGSRGLGLNLVTQYADPSHGDFLPYTEWEAYILTLALVAEARDYQIEASRVTLCNSPLLQAGYEAYHDHAADSVVAWSELVDSLCG